MRLHNARHVLQAVRVLGPSSRTDITQYTRLSAPTVATVTGELVQAGLLEERGAGVSTGGRRPQIIAFNATCGRVLGGNIGTKESRLVVADMNGNWLGQTTVRHGEDTRPCALVKQLAGVARDLLAETAPEIELLSIALGAPGMVDLKQGVVLEAANLEEWENVALGEMLQNEFGVATIIENDVNLAAIGEHWRGGAQDTQNFALISLGTGIGAALVIEGKIHRGHRWHAGEISHLNVDFREWDTDFGAAGYLETYLGDVPQSKARRAPRRNNAGAVTEEGVLRLGAAVANIATIVDPELVIWGGRAIQTRPALPDLVHEIALRMAPNCPPPRISALGEQAALWGSVRLALEQAQETLHDALDKKAARLPSPERLAKIVAAKPLAANLS